MYLTVVQDLRVPTYLPENICCTSWWIPLGSHEERGFRFLSSRVWSFQVPFIVTYPKAKHCTISVGQTSETSIQVGTSQWKNLAFTAVGDIQKCWGAMMSYTNVTMEVRVGCSMMGLSSRTLLPPSGGESVGYSTNMLPLPQHQPLSIIRIHLHRQATFGDLSIILKKRHGDWLMQDGNSYQEMNNTPLFFFRAYDVYPVGLNPFLPLASPDSNFLPDSDVLLVQSHPERPHLVGPPRLVSLPRPIENDAANNTQQEENIPWSFFGVPWNKGGSQYRAMDDPCDPRSFEKAIDTPPPTCIAQVYAVSNPSSSSVNSFDPCQPRSFEKAHYTPKPARVGRPYPVSNPFSSADTFARQKSEAQKSSFWPSWYATESNPMTAAFRRPLPTDPSGKLLNSPRGLCLANPYGETNTFAPDSIAQMYEDELIASSYWPWYATAAKSDSKPAAVPRPPQNDHSGKILVHGSISQYNLDGGQSACTAICVVAAVRILSAENESVFEQMSSPVRLDEWVSEGVRLYRDVAGVDIVSSEQHASVKDIFESLKLRHFGISARA